MNKTIVSTFPLPVVSVKNKTNFSFRILRFLTVWSIIALFFVSILQLNSYTKEIYLIKEYQNKIQSLTQENKNLEISFSQNNSLKNIGSFAQNQAFEKADKIEYIKILGSTALAK